MATAKTKKDTVVEIGGKEYTLKMTRSAVRWGELRGLDIAQAESQPLNTITTLFACALRGGGLVVADSKYFELADEYFDAAGDLTDVMAMLIEMYSEVFHIRG